MLAATFLLAGLSSAVAIPATGGIFVPDYFEQRCLHDKGFVTANFVNWVGNLTEGTPLYFPLLSSLDILRVSQDLFGEADLSFLSVDDVLNSCITLTATNTRFSFKGYCGRTVTKDVLQTGQPLVFRFNKVFPQGFGATLRVSLSDNKSWQVVDLCWNDGQRTFAVISLHPYLSVCTRRVIVEHLKAIGFLEKYFTGLTYDADSCKVPCYRPATLQRQRELEVPNLRYSSEPFDV